jgi:two-component system alkaline phosphatase synthesis response regulator PhoP
MKVIYYVEHDNDSKEFLSYALKTLNYEVAGVVDNKSLMEKLKQKVPDLILLDIMIPNVDGVNILKKLKNHKDYKDIPVIIVTFDSREEVKVKCFDLGADDFITKPFGMLELFARINAVLRYSKKFKDEQETVIIKDLIIDYKKREVKYKNNYVDLNYKELEIFYFLIMNKSLVLSKEKIIKRIWGAEFSGNDRVVSTYVNSIRRKLNSVDCNDVIKTVRGAGYKFKDMI